MIPTHLRLKSRAAFAATYRIKNSFYRGGIALFAGLKKKDAETYTKAGFVVSKKTHKRAVKRNRLKRLMRESYRLLLKENDMGNSQEYISLIFVGHEKALGRNFDEIKSDIKYLLKGLN